MKPKPRISLTLCFAIKVEFLKRFTFFHYIFFLVQKIWCLEPPLLSVCYFLRAEPQPIFLLVLVFWNIYVLCKKFSFLKFFLLQISSSDLLKIIRNIIIKILHYDQKKCNNDIPSLHLYKLSPFAVAKMYFPYQSYEDKRFDLKIFCWYLINSIFFCWNSNGIIKLVVFISPCHVVFYKKLMKILKRYQVEFFVSVFMYL